MIVLIEVYSFHYRAEMIGKKYKSFGFVSIVDLNNFAFNKCPPFSMVKLFFGLLKAHYPARLKGLYIINPGHLFTIAWNMVNPFIPSKAKGKIRVLSDDIEKKKIFDETIGLDYIEKYYGGTREDFDFNNALHMNKYMNAKF